MKKTELTIKEKTFYRIVSKIDKFAVVEEKGQLGLIILHSGVFLVPLGDYVLDREKDFLIFTKKSEDGKEDSVTMFNITNRMCYQSRKLVEKIKDGIMILQNSFDEKMRLFSCNDRFKDNDPYKQEFDSYTVGKINGKYWIILSLGNKKGLYLEDKGMVTPLDQDDIKVVGDKIIFSKDGHTRFNVENLWSEEYDSITVDPNLEDIVYCQRGNEIFAYYIWYPNNTEPVTVPILKTYGNSIELAYYNKTSNSFQGLYQFIVGENEHYTIREVKINKIDSFMEGTLVTSPDVLYDFIHYDRGVYFVNSSLSNQNKNETSSGCEILYPYKRVPDGYFRSVPIGKDQIAYFSENGKCHIRNKANIYDSSAFENVKSIRAIENGFIYNDGLQDILFVSCKDDDTFSESADEIQWLGNNYYLVSKNGIKRLHHHGKEISDVNILNASIHSNHADNSFDGAKNTWVILELDCKNNRFQLASMVHHHNKPATAFKVWKNFEWAAFYPDFILTQDELMKLYSYEGELLAILPSYATIDIVGHCGETTDEPTIYRIEGENYIFQDGNLISIPDKNRPLYMAMYEGEYGYVIVNASSQQEYEEKCAQIDSMDDKTFETVLENYYNSSSKIQEKYPALVLKQIQKK